MQELDTTPASPSRRGLRLGLSGRATSLILGIVSAAFMACVAYIYIAQSAATRSELDANMAKLSTASAGRVGNWLRGKIDLTQLAAQEIGATGGEATPERVFELPVLRETFPVRYIGRPDGSFTQVPYEQMPAGYDPRQRGWYKGAVEANGPFVTDPYRKAGTGVLTITSAAPVRGRGGDLLGVIGTNIDLTALDRLLSNARDGNRTYAYLVSGAGKILFHPQSDLIGKSLSDLITGPLPKMAAEPVDTTEGARATLTVLTRIPNLPPSLDWYVGLSVDRAEAFAPLDHLSKTLVAATVVALLVLAVVVGRLMTVTVARPLNRLVSVLQSMAQGDVDAAIGEARRRDEIGAVGRAVEGIRTMVARKALEQAEMKRIADEAAAAERRRTMIALADGFERAVGGIVGTVSSSAAELQATARTMTTNASHTASRSTSVAAAAEEAAANVGTVAAAAEELGASVQEIARQVAGSADMAQGAVAEADQTARLMQDLSEAVARIGDVVGMITTIAGQTNLLALNATIEAARAGEAGRGFAVVAAEVKELASQTARATDEITGHIQRIQGSTGHAVAAIGGIAARIREINDVATSIAAAVEEQGAATAEIVRNVAQAAAGAGEVTGNITGVAGAAEETGAAASQVLASASELSRQSACLSSEVQTFLSTVRAA
ncbi:methyl-accepting chemotaxis protein [Methylobacterium radiotolerans]|uniref:methyl-accepting chemotaxis protein n=1 Tax=Methylobacterium radiotolerans TaxID=31998 RepID=UPI001F1C1357|nr:methyl-accepting chemotaxis protein [Methylobacterium radiotolerans]UIY45288.1 methyl-accepting chemotaxis protein [Methylobacterium radiotolerans]